MIILVLCAGSLLTLLGEETEKSVFPENLVFGIPVEPDQLLRREAFSIGYSRRNRQALWVSYVLTAEHLEQKKVKRKNRFRADPEIWMHPVRPADYRRSGYDKGHLAPAADMTYAELPMERSFYMTNISPQLPGCNRGIWKRLESKVREWAKREKRICVVTGPVITQESMTMGKARIPVPVAFYKVILDLTPPMKMIGFLVPNQTTKKRLPGFVLSVDELENLTGYDFFSSLPETLQNRLEKQADFDIWDNPPSPDPAHAAPGERQ